MDKYEKTKIEWIKAFQDDAERRIDFLVWLDKEKHRYEALTLCVSYIDSFAQWLCWPSSQPSQSGKNFVDAIVKFGGNQLTGLVHPLQAIRSFKALKPSWQQIAIMIKEVFPGPEYELISEDDFLSKLNTRLSAEELNKLKLECWRGTVAAIAYYF